MTFYSFISLPFVHILTYLILIGLGALCVFSIIKSRNKSLENENDITTNDIQVNEVSVGIKKDNIKATKGNKIRLLSPSEWGLLFIITSFLALTAGGISIETYLTFLSLPFRFVYEILTFKPENIPAAIGQFIVLFSLVFVLYLLSRSIFRKIKQTKNTIVEPGKKVKFLSYPEWFSILGISILISLLLGNKSFIDLINLLSYPFILIYNILTYRPETMGGQITYFVTLFLIIISFYLLFKSFMKNKKLKSEKKNQDS